MKKKTNVSYEDKLCAALEAKLWSRHKVVKAKKVTVPRDLISGVRLA